MSGLARASLTVCVLLLGAAIFQGHVFRKIATPSPPVAEAGDATIIHNKANVPEMEQHLRPEATVSPHGKKMEPKLLKGAKTATPAPLFPLLSGFNPQLIKECMKAGHMNQWLFTGTSHVRNLIETLSALLLDQKVTKFKWMKGVVQPLDPLPSGLNLSYIRDAYLMNNLTAPLNIPHKLPDAVAQYDVILLGRYMWDLDRNNTFPHDFFEGVVDRLEDILRRFHLLSKGSQTPNLKKIFVFMPYALKKLEQPELFLTNQLQCRTSSRIHMYRRMVRCAAHYANTRSRFSGNINGVQSPKVELFDTFEFTESLPDSAATNGANHYHYQHVQSMLAQLFERHICPGRDIARKGFNTQQALSFDSHPWAGVDEDCAEVYNAAEKPDAAPEYGPIGRAVEKEQIRQPPTTFDRAKMHLYRNYTPVSNETGEVRLNGLRIVPAPMRPIDKLYQSSFDRLAISCSMDRNLSNEFIDGELLRSMSFSGGVAAHNFFCKIKRAFEQGVVMHDGLPTYLNMRQMNNGHWQDLLSLVLMSCSKANCQKKTVISGLRDRLKMCLFNLGGRAEDISDELHIQLYLSRQISSKQRFLCQCSGMFAPHLLREKQRSASQIEIKRQQFCDEWKENEVKIGLEKIPCSA